MATWVTHFRIAEKLMESGIDVSMEEFVVGNIGPDCGLPTERGFRPAKEITHFIFDKKINADRFSEQYLNDREIQNSSKKYSFFLGYYSHLITDQEWIRLCQEKNKETIYQEILGKPEYSRIIKTDWYGLDFVFLKADKDNVFWNTFQYIKEFPDYLEFFEKGQISKQISRITNFYLSNTIPDDHEFKYLSMKEVDDFVDDTTVLIYEILRKRMPI